MTGSNHARISALEAALVAGLRAGDPEEARQCAAALQDDMLDEMAVGAHASNAFRASFNKQRRQLAAQIGAPILPDAPDKLM